MSWIDVGDIAAVTRAKKVVIDVDGLEVLVLAHDNNFYGFANRCIHKQRELAKGVVLNGKLVCPGHQWAFALGTGWESVKDQCQPTYPVRVVDGRVEVQVIHQPTDLVPAMQPATDMVQTTQAAGDTVPAVHQPVDEVPVHTVPAPEPE
jgi:nitrite reductase (NADH) small subunit